MGRKSASASAFVFLRKIIFSHGNEISSSILCKYCRRLEQLVGKLQYHTSSNSIQRQRQHTAAASTSLLVRNFIDTRSSLHIPTLRIHFQWLVTLSLTKRRIKLPGLEKEVVQYLGFLDSAINRYRASYATECTQYTTDSMAASQLNVIHDTKNNFFFIDLPGDGSLKKGYKAKLDYSWTSPTLVNMYHTEVPPQFQGKGIAKLLAKAAFDYFSENGFTMTLTCTYLQKYLKENPIPKYMNHVEESFKQ